MNTTKRKVVDRVFKNHKPLFINISDYRDISVQIRPLFANFLLVKRRFQDQAPSNLDSHQAFISTQVASKYSFARQVVFEL